jgi:hypothetical protein
MAIDRDYQYDNTYEHTRDFLHRRLDKFIDKLVYHPYGYDGRQQELMGGLHSLYPIVINCLPLAPPDDPETFVLAPPDFGSQNILCDEEGNITAIIDWDCIETKPRFVDWLSLPDWLCKDWWGAGHYRWPNKCMSPQDMDKYRHEYAAHLREACGEDAGYDYWKYTTKSPMFDVVYEALSSLNEERMLRVMKDLLARILPGMDHEELIREIGRGEENGDAYMGSQMMKYFYRSFRDLFGTEEGPAECATSVAKKYEVNIPTPKKSEKKDDGKDMVKPASKKCFCDVSIGELWELYHRNQSEVKVTQSGATKRHRRSSML